MEFDFISAFYEKIHEKKMAWEVCALASPDGLLYSLGSDSKLIGRIFELLSYKILEEIAQENGFLLLASDRQTVYPDFTLMKSREDGNKIAIDIKTTYRSFKKNGRVSDYIFTLGSYNSFLRDGKKNIMFPYEQYEKHYVVGFIYTRNAQAAEGKSYSLDKLQKIPVPYKDVEVFVQEKYKIAGEKKGSGNTENIGSYRTNIVEKLARGEGPFSVLGEKVFEDYWRGYPKYREKQKNYTSLEEYFAWSKENGKEISREERAYLYWKKAQKRK